MADNILAIRHLSKSFGTHEVLRDIDFDVKKGDVISIIGASGSGKSTLLRCINLLETPTSGEILYHGKNVTGKSVNAAKYRSHVGMVFQSFNLFASQKKGWLPPSYGKKSYHDMSKAEQKIVDSYEGEASYTDTLARHLIPTKATLLQLNA